MFKVLTWPPSSPDLYPTEHWWEALDKQVCGGSKLQVLKNLLVISWCEIQKHTFRGLVESIH